MSKREEANKLKVTALNVGHGDAILIQWQEKNASWTALIDGGSSPSMLKECLTRSGVTRLDLVVGTHLDTDHVGGFTQLAGAVEVREYWGPALPAFQRHTWLFGNRGDAAIKRGAEIERSFKSADIPIIYPVEGYSSAPLGTNGPKLVVLSPPPKLIKKLLVDEDISWLMTGSTTPMGWLLDAEPIQDEGDNTEFPGLDAELRSGALSPSALQGHVRGATASEDVSRTLQRQWAEQHDCDPEFFGDPLLNNTSLVIWMEVRTGSINHRLLFPGDLENWSYLFAANSRGLQPDILKASHHGGRVFLEADRCEEELLRFLRPRAIVISANGNHRLPRNHLRQAAVSTGSTVLCTSRRGRELVSVISQDDDKSCFDCYKCDGGSDVVITLDGSGILASKQACHSGFGISPGAVIEVRHHIVDPSPVVQRLFENELRKYIRWTKQTLASIHTERRMKFSEPRLGNEVVSQEQLENIVRAKKMHTLLPHIQTVLLEGHKRQQFWSSAKGGSHSSSYTAYSLPSNMEQDNFLEIVRSKKLLLFKGAGNALRMDRMTFLAGLPDNGLALLSEGHTQLPQQAFHESLWPKLLQEFETNWKCYVHHTGVTGLTLDENIAETYLQLLTVYAKNNSFNKDAEWSVCFDGNGEEHLLDGPIVANMNPDERSSNTFTPSWDRLLKSWFSPSEDSLSECGWTRPSYGSPDWKKRDVTIILGELWMNTHYVDRVLITDIEARPAFTEIASVLASNLSRAW